MGTPPKDPKDMQRPNRRLGEALCFALACPLCGRKADLRVIAYRTNTVRLACRECGLRFSVDRAAVIEAINALDSFEGFAATVIYNRHET